MRSAWACVTAGACWPSGTITVADSLGVGVADICGQASGEHPVNRSAETATIGTIAKRAATAGQRLAGAAGA